MFRTSGEQIYAAVGEQMARQAYGQWSIVLTEANGTCSSHKIHERP